MAARFSRCSVAVGVAGYLGVNPLDFVAPVVAFAFGSGGLVLLPCDSSSGIFWKRTTREGADRRHGRRGSLFTAAYIVYFKFVHPELNSADHWWLGVSPEGIGTVGMLINFALAITVSRFTPMPPPHVLALVNRIRVPSGAGEAHELNA